MCLTPPTLAHGDELAVLRDAVGDDQAQRRWLRRPERGEARRNAPRPLRTVSV